MRDLNSPDKDLLQRALEIWKSTPSPVIFTESDFSSLDYYMGILAERLLPKPKVTIAEKPMPWMERMERMERDMVRLNGKVNGLGDKMQEFFDAGAATAVKRLRMKRLLREFGETAAAIHEDPAA